MPLLWPALGMALGLFAGAVWHAPPPALALLLVSVAGAWLLSRSAGLRLGFAALFLAAFLLGVLRSGPDLLEPHDTLAPHHDRRVVVTGAVHGLPETVGVRVRFELHASSLALDDATVPAEARVLVWAGDLLPVDGRAHPYLAHGDTVIVRGRLEASRRIGGFDYPEHLAARGIGSVLSHAEVVEVVAAHGLSPARAVQAVRRALAGAIDAHVPEPQAALTQALLLGMRGGMPADVSDDFRRAGIAHLLAVSGMHVGLVLGLSLLASAALVGRHRRAYLVPPLVLLWAYVLLAGAPASAVRAAAMGSLFVLALATGRAAVALNALGLAALVMLAWEPRVLWDRSFQLSFAAMAGVLAVGLHLWLRVEPFFRTWDETGLRWLALATARWAVASLLVSLGATLGSLPLVAFNFQQVPLLGIPATLLALPLLPFLLVSGALASVVGVLVPPLAPALAWLPTFFGGLVVWNAAAFAAVPWSALETDVVGPRAVWLYYALGFALFAALYRSRWLPGAIALAAALWRGPARPAHALLVVVAFAILAAAPWAAAQTRPDGYLHVHFLDVGQGDATLVRTPGGLTLLIDSGPDPRVTLRALDALLPATRPVIDLAVLTHPHADHMTGLLELARRGRIARVLVPPLLPDDEGAWLDELRRHVPGISTQGAAGLPGFHSLHGVHTVTAGALVALEDGVRLEVLHPPLPLMAGTRSDVDNNSVAVRLVYGDAAVLFTGDLYAEGELVLIASGADLSAQVLKLGHHGSGTSTITELLAAVRPSIAVISADPDARHGHPAPDVLDRTLAYAPEAHLYQTGLHGTISLATDGHRWWAKTQRQP